MCVLANAEQCPESPSSIGRFFLLRFDLAQKVKLVQTSLASALALSLASQPYTRPIHRSCNGRNLNFNSLYSYGREQRAECAARLKQCAANCLPRRPVLWNGGIAAVYRVHFKWELITRVHCPNGRLKSLLELRGHHKWAFTSRKEIAQSR